MNLNSNVQLARMDLAKKIEGDKKTPKGTYSLDHYFIGKINFQILKLDLKISITKNMGWCDDVESKNTTNLLR